MISDKQIAYSELLSILLDKRFKLKAYKDVLLEETQNLYDSNSYLYEEINILIHEIQLLEDLENEILKLKEEN